MILENINYVQFLLGGLILMSCNSNNIHYQEIKSNELKEYNISNGWVKILSSSEFKGECKQELLASQYSVFSFGSKDTFNVICVCKNYSHKVGDQVWFQRVPSPKQPIFVAYSSKFIVKKKVVFGELYIPDE